MTAAAFGQVSVCSGARLALNWIGFVLARSAASPRRSDDGISRSSCSRICCKCTCARLHSLLKWMQTIALRTRKFVTAAPGLPSVLLGVVELHGAIVYSGRGRTFILPVTTMSQAIGRRLVSVTSRERAHHVQRAMLSRPRHPVCKLRCPAGTHLASMATAAGADGIIGMPGIRLEDMIESSDRPRPSFARPSPAEVVSTIVEAIHNEQRDRTHVLAILCDNEAGVLSRVAGLLSARGFNIDSLTVSPTNLPDLSRMTIVMKDVSDPKIDQALKQLSDIVNVWACVNYTGTNSLTRELVMVKVSYLPHSGGFKADAAPSARLSYDHLLRAQPHRTAVRDIGTLFGADVVDVGSRHITFQLTSWSRRIDAFIKMLEPWGIIEVARSGVVAMLRSPVSGTEADRIPTPSSSTTTPADALPPG